MTASPADSAALMRTARDCVRKDEPAAAWAALDLILETAPAHAEALGLRAALLRRLRHRLLTAVKAETPEPILEAAAALSSTGEFREEIAAAVASAAPLCRSGDELVALLLASARGAGATSHVWDALADAIRSMPASPARVETAFEAVAACPGHAGLLDALAGLIDRHPAIAN